MVSLSQSRKRRHWNIPLTSPAHPQNATAMYHGQLTETVDASTKHEARSFDTPPHSSNVPWSLSANPSSPTQPESASVDAGRYGMEWTRGAYDTDQPMSYTNGTPTVSTHYSALMNDYSEVCPQQTLPSHYNMNSSSRTENFLTSNNTTQATTAISNVGFPFGASQPAAEDYFKNNQLQPHGAITSNSLPPQPPFFNDPYQPPQYSNHSRSGEPGLNTSMLPLPQSSYQPGYVEQSTLARPTISPNTSTQTLSLPQTYNTHASPDTALQLVDDDYNYGNINTPGMANLEINSTSSSSSTSTCYHCGVRLDDADSCYAHMWREHANTMGPWPQGESCSWDNCDCRQTFKTPKKWLQHVDQRHEKRIWCPEKGCSAGAFGSKADLKRHHESIHEAPARCPHSLCKGGKSKLNRRDKRNEHLLRYHGNVFCPVADCLRKHIEGVDYGFASQLDLNKHMIRHHGPRLFSLSHHGYRLH